jgi:hypothetical protein
VYSKGRATVHFSLRMIGDRFDSSFLSLRTVPNAERPHAITTDITVNPATSLRRWRWISGFTTR